MANKDQLKAVAQNCSQYENVSGSAFTSDVGSSMKSCETCKNYTKDHQCTKNIKDEILSRLDS